MNKTTLVLGASENPERYSYKAVMKLISNGHKVYPLGIKSGEINGLNIATGNPEYPDVNTVSLYVSPANQNQWKDYIYSLHPKRIIFNPGTENQEFEQEASKRGIECVEACTLVMLGIGNY